jgi:hypothetical protein
MAEIAVERKRGFPWWAWLLLALVALLLLWALFGRDRGGVAEGETSGPIRDLAVLYNPDNPDALVGREVRIDNANVLNVTGDRDFWVGEREGRQVLVILNQVMTPQQPRIEGRYDVNAGQTISIVEGEVKRFPGWEEAQSRWNLKPDLRSNFENQRVYIEADKLDIKDSDPSRHPVQTQPK